MKKTILILVTVLISLGVYSQNKQEAIEFLKTNVFEWGCPNQKYASGTFTQRLQISLHENGDSSYLFFRVKRDEDLISSGWFNTTIYISKIKRFSITNESSDCRKLLIHTEVNGIETCVSDNNNNVTVPYSKMKRFYVKYGWKNDNILLYGDKERNDRIIKALTFLVTEYGGEITESNF